MHVPCNLRTLRGKRPITEIEQASGVHRGTLSMLERGRLFPTEKQIDGLERAYGVAVHEFWPPYVLAVLDREVDEAA
jgi:transcriptional regulator with XRE-family HTH domain